MKSLNKKEMAMLCKELYPQLKHQEAIRKLKNEYMVTVTKNKYVVCEDVFVNNKK